MINPPSPSPPHCFSCRLNLLVLVCTSFTLDDVFYHLLHRLNCKFPIFVSVLSRSGSLRFLLFFRSLCWYFCLLAWRFFPWFVWLNADWGDIKKGAVIFVGLSPSPPSPLVALASPTPPPSTLRCTICVALVWWNVSWAFLLLPPPYDSPL